MGSQSWYIFSIIGLVLGGILFAISALMFFTMKIPYVIGNLTGRTATKEIEKMRRLNEDIASRGFKLDEYNIKRETLADPISIQPENKDISRTKYIGGATDILVDIDNEFVNITDINSNCRNYGNETEILSTTGRLAEDITTGQAPIIFNSKKSITIIHTNEEIT